ncbi:hypothetical protein AURDEDRAFT_146987 [Auricularia subglabra TFB-10046 SS5]|uniref:S-adenosyl-L-methionine-dependent methyltransferase n=1 Tax=Auricularia subglabra (strain TFB-10046 / SS5) TaxID=717982 RepID=J0D058_AURST|nr:hypothetical protein AURDEDRAFT_146987 [Auricularia subglabra TFB-10046 SS5]
MFFYLSFLRPPPCACLDSSPSITITPQIANDLRTELYQAEVDIYYIWLSSSGSATSPAKLTRWRAGNAYKPLSVPLPGNTRPGDAWRLLMWAGEAKAPSATVLDEPSDLGTIPLPVMSMPVAIVNKKGAALEKKQEEIERVFRISIGPATASIRVRECMSFDLDKKMWDSGLGLSAWLARTLRTDSEHNSATVSLVRDCLLKEQCNILELGTGTGFVSLMLYTILAHAETPKSQARILATDLPSALPLIEQNIAALKARSDAQSTCTVSVSGGVLDWDNPTIPPEAAHPDIIVMADVTYNTAAFPSLVATIELLNPPLLLMGYKERDPAERELWDMLKSVRLTRVDEVPGAGGAPVEIWIGEMTPE